MTVTGVCTWRRIYVKNNSGEAYAGWAYEIARAVRENLSAKGLMLDASLPFISIYHSQLSFLSCHLSLYFSLSINLSLSFFLTYVCAEALSGTLNLKSGLLSLKGKPLSKDKVSHF